MPAPLGNKNALGNRGGRPRKGIDMDAVEKLCVLQCTGEEIARYLGIDFDTLSSRLKETYGLGFSEYFKRKRSKALVALRSMQWQKAESGDTTMQIWLGKQYLGQTDRRDFKHELTGKDGGSVVLEPRAAGERIIESVGLRLIERLDAKKENAPDPQLPDESDPDDTDKK